MKMRNESLFGVADYYSHNLNLIGHDALEIHFNNDYMQMAWARENGNVADTLTFEKPSWYVAIQKFRKKISQTSFRKMKTLFKPLLKYLDNRNKWLTEVLLDQVKMFNPDIVINQSLDGIPALAVKMIRPHTKFLVGQIAAPIPRGLDFTNYDLMISSLPNYIQQFKQKGLKAEFHPFAFDERVLNKVKIDSRDIGFSFAGSISIHHNNRNEYLLPLVKNQGLKIWGQGLEQFSVDSEIRKVHNGPVFGKGLLSILGRSQLTFNHHIGIAENYCNNMRMFEATGMGATLLTDKKNNLGDYFEEGKEVVSYGSLEECLEKVEYLSNNPEECRRIGSAGQVRVLKDHNYKNRMEELSSTFLKCL